MTDEFITLLDWLRPDSTPSAHGPRTASNDSPLFNEALARLFAAAFESGAPPPYLRSMLAFEQWLPIPLPAPAVCAAAALRTRAYSPPTEHRSVASRKKKRATPVVPATAQNTIAFEVASRETAEPDANAVEARHVLAQLPQSIRAVVVRFGDDHYSFNRDQCRALREYFQRLAAKREAADQEQRDLRLLAGEGSLDEFLDMHVRVDPALKPLPGDDAGAIAVQTLGFANRRSDGIVMSLREFVQRIAARDDLDGVQFNRPYSGTAAFEFGPNFADWCRRGIDPRHAGTCPAQPIPDIDFGIYLTRPFTRVDAQLKAMISVRLDQARALLAAIEPGHTALARGALVSLEGARALRRFPHVAERRWLVDFIARGERALRTRWRIGVF